MNMNSYFGSVSGFCMPCKDIQDAAQTAEILKAEQVSLKMGKEAGVWYVVAQNSGAHKT